jgi:hypothetical protein
MIQPQFSKTIIGAVVFLFANQVFAADPILPNPKLTPGVFRKNLTVAKICRIKWGPGQTACDGVDEGASVQGLRDRSGAAF